jgi:F-type H+-transporting ATPase subunit delta
MKFTDKQLANVLFETVEKGNKKDISAITDEFVRFLAERAELHRIFGVIQSFEKIWKEQYGAATITVESAHPLSVSLKKQVEEIAPGAEIREIVNEELIGGAKIRLDDRSVDGSISGRLNQIKLALLNS